MLGFTLPIPRPATILLTLALAGCAGITLHESSGEYLDDTVITARVKASLLAHREVSAAQVNVETFKDRVQLSGCVKSKLQRFEAEAIARSVRGVSEVINDIQLR
ncbi:osmotically-inducible protein OsmY [Variovorax boronicumulans]|uniref:BON domain-containing protein n=1 Tax=Variovorax boronicumulans TaxID=436515 RepID=UPI002782E034|nr:BON domain-containing protein [Variovorax boronicumulans]MDQ0036851.1 osmotically-inducible protein OsmY [Variovorax boronicumulans]